MNMIFDTHAHYDDESFDEDRETLLSELPNKNIFSVVNAAANIESSKKSVLIAKKYSYIYAAVGVHPENISDMKFDYILEMKNMINECKKIVAIGEIGLDYHYSKSTKIEQLELFENQVKFALECNLPVIVHDREAHGDTQSVLKKYKPRGVVHCFSGSRDMAKEIIGLGMYLGIGGVVTFKNAKNIVDVVENVDLSKIVLETDAPYMTPVPFRGERCNSTHIEFTAQKIAEIKNIDKYEVLKVTKKNAIDLFEIEV